MLNPFSQPVSAKDPMNRLAVLLLCAISLVLLLCSNTSAQEATPGQVGSGMGSVILNYGLENLKREGSQTEIISQQAASASAQGPAISAIQAPDIIGIYKLVSCFVQYADGSTFECSQVTFTGDMAITSQNTLWQRLAASGFQTLVGSGTFTLTNDRITLVNDLVLANSILDLTWNPPNLTTVTTVAGNTETDVWERTVAPAVPCPSPTDSDGDGVIDSLDNCPGTPAGSFVDSDGCPGSGSVKVVPIPLC